jgi:hypothetical protein
MCCAAINSFAGMPVPFFEESDEQFGAGKSFNLIESIHEDDDECRVGPDCDNPGDGCDPSNGDGQL